MSTGGSRGIGPPGPPDETGWRTKLLLLRLQRRSRLARSDDLPNRRVVKAPRGTELSAKSWLTEAPLRMLMNHLDPGVPERPRSEDRRVGTEVVSTGRSRWSRYH